MRKTRLSCQSKKKHYSHRAVTGGDATHNTQSQSVTVSIYIITKEHFLPSFLPVFSIPRETSPPLADLLLGLLQRNQKDRMDFGQCTMTNALLIIMDFSEMCTLQYLGSFPPFMEPRNFFRNSVTLAMFLAEPADLILIHGLHFQKSFYFLQASQND